MKKVGQSYRENLVNQVKKGVAESDNMFLLSYSRVSGLQMNDLRKDLKKKGARVCVTKNSVVRLALKEIQQEGLSEKISGQTALIWGGTDSAEVSKILINFVKDSEHLIVQGGLLQGRVLQRDDVKKLSELPSREVLLAMLLGVIQSPLTRLAGALNAKTRELLSILKQLSEKKGGN
ncbi:MAG TPA: 50S ribosomal protein L10 [Candidatus Omnitrophota bacterium]|nr:50S ribosomal protein L10 [Candidatus Omnitrophota bacterium]